MIEQLLGLIGITREIRGKVIDALLAAQEKEHSTAKAVQEYLKKDVERLDNAWPKRLNSKYLGDLRRHIYFGQLQDYKDMLKFDIPGVESELDKYFKRKGKEGSESSFKGLLHPVIISSSYEQFERGLLRDAVLNGVVAVFDFIRARTGSRKDGSDLVGEVFSIANPKLIFSEIKTESGQSDQKGFLQIFQGTFSGIRNPKAHTLVHDLDNLKASQYLVFLSLLARRVEEARIPGTN